MKILLLEDAGSIYTAFNGHATEHHIEFIKALQVSEAEDKMDQDFDFILVDLNLIPTGLTKFEVDHSEGGKLSGWIWLENYLFKRDADWKKRVIIYSEYIALLKSKISPDKLKSIELMDKNKFGIVEVINKMLKMIEVYNNSKKQNENK